MPDGWRTRLKSPVRGWSDASIVEVYKSKWPRFVERTQSTRPWTVSLEAANVEHEDVLYQNSVLIFAYALALAARQRQEVSVLDWGGGIGHYSMIARVSVPDVTLDYSSRDLPLFSQAGSQFLPNVHFFSDDTCFERRYDLVVASGSLHYSEHWMETFDKLWQATTKYLLVTLLPTVLEVQSYVFLQRPFAYGYATEYLGWCLNREEFLEHAEQLGAVLAREFLNGYEPAIAGAPGKCQYRAFLFRRDQAAE